MWIGTRRGVNGEEEVVLTDVEIDRWRWEVVGTLRGGEEEEVDWMA